MQWISLKYVIVLCFAIICYNRHWIILLIDQSLEGYKAGVLFLLREKENHQAFSWYLNYFFSSLPDNDFGNPCRRQWNFEGSSFFENRLCHHRCYLAQLGGREVTGRGIECWIVSTTSPLPRPSRPYVCPRNWCSFQNNWIYHWTWKDLRVFWFTR